MFKQYIDYIKDNPNGYWFKRKLYGWGWTPARWQGWLVIFVFLGIICAISFTLPRDNASAYDMTQFFVELFIAIAALILICYKTGERPRWQWGIKK